MSISSSQLDTGIIIRRSLFFLLLIALTLGNLFIFFRGLNSPQGMDQAQIAREISRGNGFTTKFIRPVAYDQAQLARNGTVEFTGFQDTYESPLGPLITSAVFKMIGADRADAWQLNPKGDVVFPLDRVVAVISTLFFLMAIGVNYLLVCRIFDAKIGGVCALLMLFCQIFWDYSLSGLPQMLMLLLFSCGIYFVYRAVEATADGKIAMVPALIAGVFFTLLALTQWMTVWIALGFLIYAAVAFRPRGIVGISLFVMILLAAIPTLLRNQGITGNPFGTAYLTLYGGLGNGVESAVMRAPDLNSLPPLLDGIISKVIRNSLLLATDIIPLLAGIVVAPLFFLALLHPFKRASIANFRWTILLMWITAALGLAFFGVSSSGVDANQILLLFAPIMTAYGLAFISILWSRLEFVATIPVLRNVHHIVIVGICALPMILLLPNQIRNGMYRRDQGGVPQWPPYYAPALNVNLKNSTTEKQITFSDQPWAVAWYADRISIWLPPTKTGFEKLESAANELRTPVSGILISPSSHGSAPMSQVIAQYGDFASLVIDGLSLYATYGPAVLQRYSPQVLATDPQGFSTYNRDARIQSIVKSYPYRQNLFSMDMIYYSSRKNLREN